MRVEVQIMLKNGVLDPQAKAITQALHTMGFDTLTEIKIGKSIFLEFSENDTQEIRAKVERMCEELLANTVIEDYVIKL